MAQNQPVYSSKQTRIEKGYFTNSNIVEHATATMNILKQDYSDEDHVFGI